MGLFSRFRSKKHTVADPREEQRLSDETGSRDGVIGSRVANPYISNDPEAESKLRAAYNPDDDGAQTAKIERERRRFEHGL